MAIEMIQNYVSPATTLLEVKGDTPGFYTFSPPVNHVILENTDSQPVYVRLFSGGVVTADLVTEGDFSGTDDGDPWTLGDDWTYDTSANEVDKGAGAETDAVTQTMATAIVQGARYLTVFEVDNWVAVSVHLDLGGTAGAARAADGIFDEVLIAGATQILGIVPLTLANLSATDVKVFENATHETLGDYDLKLAAAEQIEVDWMSSISGIGVWTPAAGTVSKLVIRGRHVRRSF